MEGLRESAAAGALRSLAKVLCRMVDEMLKLREQFGRHIRRLEQAERDGASDGEPEVARVVELVQIPVCPVMELMDERRQVAGLDVALAPSPEVAFELRELEAQLDTIGAISQVTKQRCVLFRERSHALTIQRRS